MGLHVFSALVVCQEGKGRKMRKDVISFYFWLSTAHEEILFSAFFSGGIRKELAAAKKKASESQI